MFHTASGGLLPRGALSAPSVRYSPSKGLLSGTASVRLGSTVATGISRLSATSGRSGPSWNFPVSGPSRDFPKPVF